MAKMTKKQMAEAMAKAALLHRIRDVYVGAQGYEYDSENNFVEAEELGRIVPALQVLFGVDTNEKSNGYLWYPEYLRHFASPDAATDWLFSGGVRA
ncbi:MAG TPA: hypothetical protein VM223_14460 [Planctomycetota bacterium]|nr:hypothetical protein [Planctomycetota bacterium]